MPDPTPTPPPPPPEPAPKPLVVKPIPPAYLTESQKPGRTKRP